MNISKTSALISLALTASSFYSVAETDAKSNIDFRLRYESVSQDNALKDADALTLRTRLNYQTASYLDLSAFVEFEDSRVVLGVDDYNNGIGSNSDYSVIADPATTELDQAYLQYKTENITAKIGRQVMNFDGQRFIGDVGWRQDRQTFDGAIFVYQATEKLEINYGYISQRNRIFAEVKDLQAKDHLLNASYMTPFGKLTGYGYLLEVDEGVDNSLDTFGVSFVGKKDNFSYTAEFASQDSETIVGDYNATYIALEAGYSFSAVTVKVGFEVLGSDDGMYGFSTPLATLHKFNGWSDQFLNTPKEGLQDLSASISGKALGGKWLLAFHDFSTDDSSAAFDDFGTEINAVYSKSFYKNYSAGIKFAAYDAGDSASGKVDTDKVWLWVGAKF